MQFTSRIKISFDTVRPWAPQETLRRDLDPTSSVGALCTFLHFGGPVTYPSVSNYTLIDTNYEQKVLHSFSAGLSPVLKGTNQMTGARYFPGVRYVKMYLGNSYVCSLRLLRMRSFYYTAWFSLDVMPYLNHLKGCPSRGRHSQTSQPPKGECIRSSFCSKSWTEWDESSF